MNDEKEIQKLANDVGKMFDNSLDKPWKAYIYILKEEKD